MNMSGTTGFCLRMLTFVIGLLIIFEATESNKDIDTNVGLGCISLTTLVLAIIFAIYFKNTRTID